MSEAPVGMVNLAVFERMSGPGQPPSRWGYLGNAFGSQQGAGEVHWRLVPLLAGAPYGSPDQLSGARRSGRRAGPDRRRRPAGPAPVDDASASGR